jgi:hypothetical protein
MFFSRTNWKSAELPSFSKNSPSKNAAKVAQSNFQYLQTNLDLKDPFLNKCVLTFKNHQ